MLIVTQAAAIAQVALILEQVQSLTPVTWTSDGLAWTFTAPLRLPKSRSLFRVIE